MTEAEWLECADPKPMLEFLQGKASDRKLRLFGCACCRRIWPLLGSVERRAVEVVEGYADGAASNQERRAAFDQTKGHPSGPSTQAVNRLTLQDLSRLDGGRTAAMEVAAYASFAVFQTVFRLAPGPEDTGRMTAAEEAIEAEKHEECRLLRDIFDSPFRPAAFDPVWLTPAVAALAQAAYDNRTLPSGELERDRLLILADALEEAGCESGEILGHLRGPRPHVRGCHVLDLLLGKN